MRYLKRFNEGLQLKETEELMDFTENCLAFLLDEGFQLELVDRYGRNPNDPSFEEDTEYYWIDLYGPTTRQAGQFVQQTDDNRNFNWDEVKDYYIPFISLMNNRYNLVENERSYKGDLVYFKVQTGRRFDEHSFFNFTVEEIMNDNVTIPKNDFSYEDNIFCISIKISGKL